MMYFGNSQGLMSLLKVATYIEHLYLKWEAEEGFACITLFNLHNNFCVICITLSPIYRKKGFFCCFFFTGKKEP